MSFGTLEDPTDEASVAEALDLAGGLIVSLQGGQFGIGHVVVLVGVSPAQAQFVSYGAVLRLPWKDFASHIASIDVFETSLWSAIGHGPSGAPPSEVAAMFPTAA